MSLSMTLLDALGETLRSSQRDMPRGMPTMQPISQQSLRVALAIRDCMLAVLLLEFTASHVVFASVHTALFAVLLSLHVLIRKEVIHRIGHVLGTLGIALLLNGLLLPLLLLLLDLALRGRGTDSMQDSLGDTDGTLGTVLLHDLGTLGKGSRGVTGGVDEDGFDGLHGTSSFGYE
jgi:hypothetical protein